MENIKRVIFSIPSFALAAIYTFYGVKAIISPQECIRLAVSIGIPAGFSQTIVLVMGIISILAAIITIPTMSLLAFTALFPIIPGFLKFQITNEPNYIFIATILLSVLIYILKTRKTKEEDEKLLSPQKSI